MNGRCDRCGETRELFGSRMGMLCGECIPVAQAEQDAEDEEEDLDITANIADYDDR